MPAPGPSLRPGHLPHLTAADLLVVCAEKHSAPYIQVHSDFGGGAACCAGNGDVLEPTNGVCGIGSGGIYAQCAAMALIDVPGIGAEEVARRSMKIASDTCIYTNHNYVCMTLDTSKEGAKAEKKENP